MLFLVLFHEATIPVMACGNNKTKMNGTKIKVSGIVEKVIY